MKLIVKVGIVLVLIAGLGIGVLAFFLSRSRNDSYELFTATAQRTTIENVIISTGKVDSLVTVDVGSQVTGQVQELYANFNSIAREGQILAQLDPRNFQAQVRNAQANLSSARSRIETSRADRINADASLASAEANLTSARMELGKAESDLRRAEALLSEGLIPDTEVESVTIQLQTARSRLTQQDAAVEQAEAQIIARDAAILQAEAAMEQAEAALEEAELNLGYTTIRSPVDGVVISREVDVGQTVSASTSAPTLFQIANDLARMQVQASVDEADIGLLGQDNRVDFTVDAYPDDTFAGRIEQIRLNPTTTQNVVTYGVIITFDNPDLKLKPGMTANLEITVSRKEDVLSVPNAALRYEPPPRAGEPDQGGTQDSKGSSDDPPRIDGDPVFPVSGAGSGPRSAAAVVDSATSMVSMPGQLWNNGEMIEFQASPPLPPRPGRVWVLDDKESLEMRDLMIGITDGSRSEVVSGNLSEGETVVTADSRVPPVEGAEPNPGGRGFVVRGGF